MGRCFNQKEMEAMNLVPGTWLPPDPSEWPPAEYKTSGWDAEKGVWRETVMVPHSNYAERVACGSLVLLAVLLAGRHT